MGKNKEIGRPAGPKKEPVNVSILKTRAKNLRQFAVKEQKTISTIVENALDSYGITA